MKRIFAVAVVALPTLACSQIAFVRRNQLYVLPCDQAGHPMRGRTPFRVCRLWKNFQGDSVKIQWTETGKIAIEHYVDAWNGPKRFGLSQKSYASGIWLVEAKPNSKPIWVTSGFMASFGPDGKTLTYCTDPLKGDLWALDLPKATKRLLAPHATESAWSVRRDILAFVRMTKTDSLQQALEVRTYPDWRLFKALQPAVNPCELSLSPDGSMLAVHYHLSRPLTGHSVLNLQTTQSVELNCPSGISPPTIDDWSPDSKKILASWRIVDPNNDGSWIREYVGLNFIRTGKFERIGLGHDARFSQNGQSAFWLSDHKTGCQWKLGDLVWSPIAKVHPKIIVKGVSQFCVRRRSI